MAQIIRFQNDPQNASMYVPTRKLKNSVGSADDGDTLGFPALAADIPDRFATTEQPKLKFLFTVTFFPREENMTLQETGVDNMDENMFGLKRATRPNPQITYQDVNFYNYRTKVATKLDYGTVSLTFYDDVVHRAHSIFTTYLSTVSPIFSVNKDQIDLLGETDDNTSMATGSSIGTLKKGAGPFKYMRVTHYMLNPVGNDPMDRTMPQMVHYDYINPKIVNFNLDDLDMSQSDVNTIEFVFVYDSVNVVYDNPLLPSASNGGNGGSNGNVQQSVTVGEGDILDLNKVSTGGKLPGFS